MAHHNNRSDSEAISIADYRINQLLDKLADNPFSLLVLEEMEDMSKKQEPPISLRLPDYLLKDLDELVALMEELRRPEVVASGRHWGKSACLRLVINMGIQALKKDLQKQIQEKNKGD